MPGHTPARATKGKSRSRTKSLRRWVSSHSWRYWLLLTVFLAWFGLFALVAFSDYQQRILSFETAVPGPVIIADRPSPPSRLVIPALDLSLPIAPARIIDGVWQTSDETISHLEITARPQELGNMVMYGHNTQSLLGRLPGIKLNDEISIVNEEGLTLSYTVKKLSVVKPDDVKAVQPTESEKLTLYTCVGWFDSERFIVEAWPTEKSP